ncbi:MAG: Spy/CpxP family protein refolding chaperone [Ignavibacteria bacterium]|nr:Spy/CpxP family protein refolding chaperone [Ignavibacteria bacterium]
MQKKSFRSRKLKFIIPVVVIAFILTSVFGLVYAKKKFHDGPHGFLMGMMVEKLDLTADQKAQVERIRDQIKERMESKKDSRENLMDEFANEFRKGNLDKNKLRELDQKREQNMQENKDFMMDKIIEFHSILTPEQRTKAVDAMKEMKRKFHDRMEKPKDKREER